MQLAVVLETFNRRNRFFADNSDACDARVPRISVDKDRARAALPFAAAIFAARQVELIAQNAQQGSVRRGINLVRSAVYLEFGDPCDWCFGCLREHSSPSRGLRFCNTIYANPARWSIQCPAFSLCDYSWHQDVRGGAKAVFPTFAKQFRRN